jgi:hypothetical protein
VYIWVSIPTTSKQLSRCRSPPRSLRLFRYLQPVLASRAKWPVESTDTVHVLSVFRFFLLAHRTGVVPQHFLVFGRSEASKAQHGLHCIHAIFFNDKIIIIILLHGVVKAAPCMLFLIAAIMASVSRLWFRWVTALSAVLSLDLE